MIDPAKRQDFTELDDEELVGKARAGEREAMTVLLGRHHDRIRSIAKRISGNEADADDAAQEAMISILRRLDSFDERAKFSTWCYRVAANSAIDELRRRGRQPLVGLPSHEDGSIDESRLGENAPDQAIENIALRTDVDEILSSIPDNFRIPVVLRDLCDMSYDQIAEATGTAPGTVRSRISRGRSMIAAALEEREPNDDPKTS